MEDQIPQWVWPIATLLSGAFGGWVGVKVSVAKLEVQLARALQDIAQHDRMLTLHEEDLRVLDTESDMAFDKLELKRVKRQPHRGWQE